jgi:hypothetical protein
MAKWLQNFVARSGMRLFLWFRSQSTAAVGVKMLEISKVKLMAGESMWRKNATSEFEATG